MALGKPEIDGMVNDIFAQQLPPNPDWSDWFYYILNAVVLKVVFVIMAVGAVSFAFTLWKERRERQAAKPKGKESAENDQTAP